MARYGIPVVCQNTWAPMTDDEVDSFDFDQAAEAETLAERLRD